MEKARAVTEKTKTLLDLIPDYPELQKEIVAAVKKARDGSIPDYFSAAWVVLFFCLPLLWLTKD